MKFMYRSVFSVFSSTIKMLVDFFKNSKIFQIRTIANEYNEVKAKISNLYSTNMEVGIYHLHQGNFYDALFRFQLVNKFKPDTPEVLYQIGRCYLMKKNQEKAIKYFREALARDKSHEGSLYQLYKLSGYFSKINNVPLNVIAEHFDYGAISFAGMLISKKYLAPELVYGAIEKNFEKYQFPTLNILDLGCGTGICSQFLKMVGVGSIFTGVDISRQMTLISKKCKAKDTQVFQEVFMMGIDEFLQTQCSMHYNAIILSEVLHYRRDITSLLQRITKFLSNDAIIIILTRAAGSHNLEFSSSGDCFLFSKNYIKSEIENSGLQISLLTNCKIYDDSDLAGLFAIAKNSDQTIT